MFIAGISGCVTPAPPLEKPGSPLASQTAAPPVTFGDEANPNAKGVQVLPPRLGAMQKVSGADPRFPAQVRVPGRTYVVYAKICVSSAGVVDRVSIARGSEPALTESVVLAVTGWRYRPLRANGGAATPFCYLARFEFVQPL